MKILRRLRLIAALKKFMKPEDLEGKEWPASLGEHPFAPKAEVPSQKQEEKINQKETELKASQWTFLKQRKPQRKRKLQKAHSKKILTLKQYIKRTNKDFFRSLSKARCVGRGRSNSLQSYYATHVEAQKQRKNRQRRLLSVRPISAAKMFRCARAKMCYSLLNKTQERTLRASENVHELLSYLEAGLENTIKRRVTAAYKKGPRAVRRLQRHKLLRPLSRAVVSVRPFSHLDLASTAFLQNMSRHATHTLSVQRKEFNGQSLKAVARIKNPSLLVNWLYSRRSVRTKTQTFRALRRKKNIYGGGGRSTTARVVPALARRLLQKTLGDGLQQLGRAYPLDRKATSICSPLHAKVAKTLTSARRKKYAQTASMPVPQYARKYRLAVRQLAYKRILRTLGLQRRLKRRRATKLVLPRAPYQNRQRKSFRADRRKRARIRRWSNYPTNRALYRAGKRRGRRYSASTMTYLVSAARNVARQRALRVLKEQVPYFRPAYKVLYRRWHSHRTKFGTALPRRLHKQNALIWWDRYVNGPREKYGRYPRKYPDPVYRSIEMSDGFPSSAGYRRKRRVARLKFNTNRWWRPVALPHPAQKAALFFNRLTVQSSSSIANGATATKRRRQQSKTNVLTYKRSKKLSTALHKNRVWKAQVAQYLALRENNWKHIENGPLRLADNRQPISSAWDYPKREIERIVNNHPVWQLFYTRRLFATRGVDAHRSTGRTVHLLKHYFIEDSKNWLNVRQANVLAQFGLRGENLTAARDEAFLASRYALFQIAPNWWVQETQRRLEVMRFTLKHLWATEKAYSFANFWRHFFSYAGRAADTLASVSSLERALVTFSLSKLSPRNSSLVKEDSAVDSADFGIANSIAQKTFSRSYQFWLRAAEQQMKKTDRMLSSPNYNEQFAAKVTDVGLPRRRFPAANRRRASYDRVIRTFYAKTMHPQYRRVDAARFKKLRPTPSNSLFSFAPVQESTSVLRFKQRLSRNVRVTGYYNRKWRSLLSQRASATRNKWNQIILLPASTDSYGNRPLSKRRFDNAPVSAAFTEAQEEQSNQPTSSKVELAAATELLLARALRQRRESKQFVSLFSRLYRRRTAPEQILPAWIYARRNRRRKKRRTTPTGVRYLVPTERREPNAVFWGVDSLDLTVTRDQPNHVRVTAPTGESLFQVSTKFSRPRQRVKSLTVARGRVPNRSKLPKSKKFSDPTRKKRRKRRRRLRRWPLRMWRFPSKNRNKRQWRKKQVKRYLRLWWRNHGNGAARRVTISTSSRKGLAEGRKFSKSVTFNRLSRGQVRSLLYRWRRLKRKLRWKKRRRLTKRKHLRVGVFGRLRRRWRRRRRLFVNKTTVLLKRLRRQFEGITRYSAVSQAKMCTELERNFRHRFTQEQFNHNSAQITPFTFLAPTREKFVSDEEKHRQATAKQARRREHYRKTSHLVKLFTKFAPQLLQTLIDRRSEQKPLTYIGIRRLVTALYWSLRFYMKHDIGKRRPEVRDRNIFKLRRLRYQITLEAAESYFDHISEENMRSRFQKKKFSHRPSLLKGALRWLKMFFPRRHSFYLEDSKVYKDLAVTPNQVFRTHPSRNNPGVWRTDNISDAPDVQYRRLYNVRSRKTSTRFEGMLSTTQRTPTIPGYGTAAGTRTTIGTASAAKPSFFSRKYSTTAVYNSYGRAVLLTGRLEVLNRAVPTSENPLSNATTAALHRPVKVLSQGRGAKDYAPDSTELGGGSVDPRLLRGKSPRSRQYLFRRESELSSLEALRNKARLLKWKMSAHLNFSSTKTSSIYASKRWQLAYAGSTQEHYSHAVDRLRSNTQRRAYTLLRARAAFAKNSISTRTPQRCYGAVSPLLKRTLKRRRCAISNSSKFGTSSRDAMKVVSTEECPLILRNASDRMNTKAYNRAFYASRSTPCVLPYLAKSIFKRRKRKKLLRKSESKLHKIFVGKGKACTIKDIRAKSSLIPTKSASSMRTTHWFYPRAKIVASRVNATRTALEIKEEGRLENLFVWRRGEVWDEITLPWMKKERILKNWLKFRKLKLKQRGVNWSLLPQPLFKKMRARLRKLEWREPDRYFHRKGWRFAFKFYPGEQRKAPWLQLAMYRRALYSTRRHTYRRYQFPREQKRLKWMQYMRKTVYAPGADKAYIKGRRWAKTRIYNNRLFRSLFHLRNDRVAARHFKKLSRRRPKTNGFAHSLRGLGDRLDVNLMLLNLAPTVFWARLIATLKVFKVNGVVIDKASYRLKAGDHIEWDRAKLERIWANFEPKPEKYAKFRIRNSSASLPTNFTYFPQTRTAVYKGLPTMEDIRKNSRLHTIMFKVFHADMSATC